MASKNRIDRKDRTVIAKNALVDALVDASALVGHGIIYFTLFYCTLNWYTYRRIRKDIEKKKKDK